MPDGNALRKSVTSLFNPKNAATNYKCLVSKEGTAFGDIRVILGRCTRNKFFTLLRPPNVTYGGRLGLPADAFMTSNRTSGVVCASLAGRYSSMRDCY